MFKVSGSVAVLESGVGVANLQVVIYDLDDPKGAAEQGRDSFELSNVDDIWRAMQGDRLGSVLSDKRGNFELAFEIADFAPSERRPRPELLLLLLAPADAGADHPFARPVLERLLYVTRDVRFDAGRTESYYIRLPQAKLDRYAIPVSAAPAAPGQVSPEHIDAIFVADQAHKQAVTDAIGKQVRERAAPVTARIQRSKAAFARFSSKPPVSDLRSDAAVLNDGEALSPKMHTLIVNRMQAIATRERDRTRRFTLRVPASALLETGAITDPNATTVDASVEHRQLLIWYRAHRRNGFLERGPSWMQAYCRQHEAHSRFAEVEHRCRPVPPPPPGDNPPDGAIDADVDALVREQIGSMTTPEEHLAYGERRADGSISAVIHTGAADTTAYHDFHDIQIAFEHVWKGAVDSSLQPFLMGAYGEMVGYQNRVSGTDDFPAVHSVDDMRAMYQEFLGLQRMLDAASAPPPEQSDMRLPTPDAVKILLPGLTDEQWSALSSSDRVRLVALSQEFLQRRYWDDAFEDPIANERRLPEIHAEAQRLAQAARQAARERAASEATARRGRARPGVVRPHGNRLATLMAELDERLAEPYRFDIFAPDSTNYGVMLTYRQTWEPRDYQVGDLVSTIPLAPRETRRYSKRQVVRRNRLQKELEDIQTARSSESSSTSRADAEIVRNARNGTSFEQTANATINVGMFEGSFGTRFGVEAEKSSSDTKRNFREAVLKAAEEYKRQRRLEIETTDSLELESTSSGEISNPNDEIAVTYLFYELQRQYMVAESLHRLAPVVLVAREVPTPDQIDEDWLIAHDWILRRVLLDETQETALDYLATSLAGDELALESHHNSMRRQVELVDELTRKEGLQSALAQQTFDELKRLMGGANTPAEAQQLKEIGLALAFGPLSLIGGNSGERDAEKREEIAKIALERADKGQQEASARLTREVTAMQESVERYTRALQAHFDRVAAVTRLRIHVKQNILHYMQAIWDHEPADQRYFALYNIQVPWIEEADLALRVSLRGRRLSDEERARGGIGGTEPWFEISGALPLGSALSGDTPTLQKTNRTLSEVADLDNLLGYKGNYQIFPLKETTYLHDYMMQDYVDPVDGGLRDPDAAASPTTDEILEYVCCLSRHEPERLAREREGLLALVESRMAAPVREKELIVVPSDSLYIEALPGAHPIMESFKMTHRALDVKKVQAEVRGMELENLRRAARVLAGDQGDPDVDTRIEVGGGIPIVLPTDA